MEVTCREMAILSRRKRRLSDGWGLTGRVCMISCGRIFCLQKKGEPGWFEAWSQKLKKKRERNTRMELTGANYILGLESFTWYPSGTLQKWGRSTEGDCKGGKNPLKIMNLNRIYSSRASLARSGIAKQAPPRGPCKDPLLEINHFAASNQGRIRSE